MNKSSVNHIDKDIRITRQLAYVALVGSLFYILFDTLSGAYTYVFVYFILILSALFALVLIKRKQVKLAKACLLVAGNIVVASFASVENLESGIYFYFVLLSVASLTLYGYKDLRSAFFFIGFSTALFLFFFLSGYQVLPKIQLTDEYIRTSLIVNYCLILVTTTLLVFYLLQNNYFSEQELENQKESLIHTAEELEKSQHRFELAIQGSSAAIWDWDIKKDLIFSTPKLAEILKRPIDDIQNATQERFINILHPEDKQLFEQKLNDHLRNGDHFEVECRIRQGNGRFVWVLDSGQAEWDKKGTPVRMVGTFVDINDKKLAIEQVKMQNLMLAKTNEELDRFVYSTSHDLRAPLSSLLGLINLADVTKVKEERDQLIQMMRNQILKLDAYIQDITDFSRNVRVEVEKETFLLSEVVEDVVGQLKYMEGAEAVKLIYEVDEQYTLHSDKSRFKIILNNLISNAIKYRDPGKSSYLRISHRREKGKEILDFEDNGLGIEKQHQKKVFDMFYRASDKSRGSGLGLYITMETALKIGCLLSLTSVYGEGSVFSLVLPSKE